MRFGLIGTGHWARETHAEALSSTDDAVFAGVWGRDPRKAAALAEHHGVRSYADPAAMFADVEAVAFAVPPDVQASLAVEAASAGRHLLLEKPVALTLEAAQAVADAAAANGVSSVVFFTSRFAPAIADWLEDVRARDGWWGVRCVMLASVLRTDSPFASSSWRHERGALWDVGPHALSLVLPVLGPVDRVTGVRGPRDSVHLALRHTDGATSSLLLSLDVPGPAEAFEFAIFGEHGWSRAPEDHAAGPLPAFREAVTALMSSAGGGTPHPCDVRFGLEVVEILDRAEQALR